MTSRNLILSLAALAIFTFPSGAPAKDKPAPAKAEKSAAANAAAYVALMEKMFQNMSETAEAVTDVSTEDEIGAAIEALGTSTKEIQSIQKQLKKLGVPSAKVKAEIDTHTELGPKGQEAGQSLQEAMKKIPQDSPEFGAALQAYGTALTELGNDLNALEAEASGKPAPAPIKPGTGKAEDYLRVLNALLDVQDQSADILSEVTDEGTAKVAVRKIKGLTAEAKEIVKEFHGLGQPSLEANAALDNDKQLPVRTKEVVEHIQEAVGKMIEVDGAKEIVMPAMEEFSNVCKTIGEAPPAEGEEAKPAPENADAPPASVYVEVMTAFFKNVEKGCAILDGINDEASAEKATTDLGECSDELAEIIERKDALPDPEGEVAEALDKNKTLPVLGKKSKAKFAQTSEAFEKLDIEASDEVKGSLEEAGKKWIDQVKNIK